MMTSFGSLSLSSFIKSSFEHDVSRKLVDTRVNQALVILFIYNEFKNSKNEGEYGHGTISKQENR